MNESWPEFVTDEEHTTARDTATADRTGWETVVFELADYEVDELLSAFSTAADAP